MRADPKSYQAVREHAGILDLADHGFIEVTGPDRVKFLHNLVSNDIKGLKTGEGCYATLLTRAGRIVADMNIYALDERFVIEASRPSLAQALATLKKMILFAKVEVKEPTPPYSIVSIQGPEAATLLESHTPLPERDRGTTILRDDSMVVRIDRTGSGGFDIWGEEGSVIAFKNDLMKKGAVVIDAETADLVRIEAGIPLYGPELNEDVIPLEAGLEKTAISFTKGCYTGQEVIARIKTYGEVAKKLVGLKPERGVDPQDRIYKGGAEVGWITSTAISPGLEAPIALAYLKRESWEPGTEVVVKTEGGEAKATVTALPFV